MKRYVLTIEFTTVGGNEDDPWGTLSYLTDVYAQPTDIAADEGVTVTIEEQP